MNLYSTNDPSLSIPLDQAVLQGLPPDNGLYMPDEIPSLSPVFFEGFGRMSFQEIAFRVCEVLLGDSVPKTDLTQIIHESITFDAPLYSLDPQVDILELFHGPTLAFKDFGARFMAKLMGYFVREKSEKLTILVATSGDTGGAVASGFFQTPGIEVIILYPSGKVSHLQEKQLTTLGHNIAAIEVNGTFDDCQQLVKQAFLDEELRKKLWITSANSINIARLIPQMFYYFRAYQQLQNKNQPAVFCVPSGNFGNLTAGLMAQRMGLPIAHFVAATNANNIVPQYLESGTYSPQPSIPTISNAMDVGKPSNFARMLDLFGNDWAKMRQAISGYSCSDQQTREVINQVFSEKGYVLDPHTAVGYLAIKEYQKKHPNTHGVVLSTAHPSKFLDVVEPVIGQAVEVPEQLASLADKPKEATAMGVDYQAFKAYLLR